MPGPGPFPNHPPTPSKSWPPFSWFRADSAENLFTNYLNIIRTEPRVCWAEKEWRHFSAVKTQAQCASKSGLRILLELLNLYFTRQLRMYINPTNFQLHGPSILYNSLVLRIWAFLSDKDPTFQNLCTHILLYTGFPNLCWTICVLDWRIHKKMNIFYFKYVLLSYFFFYLFFDSMTCKYCTVQGRIWNPPKKSGSGSATLALIELFVFVQQNLDCGIDYRTKLMAATRQLNLAACTCAVNLNSLSLPED